MSKLYQYIAFSLLATVIGFFVGLAFIPESVIAIANAVPMVFLLVMLVVAFVMKIVKKKNSAPLRFPMWVVYAFAFVEGALLYPALMFYAAELGMSLFLSIVIGTMVIFGVLAAMGHKSKDGSFVGLGRTLFVILLVMILVSVVNMFMQVDTVSMLLSAAGVLVFSLYIVVDVNQFKTAYNAGYINDEKDYSIFVLNIYLDIINLLLDILDLVRRIKN